MSKLHLAFLWHMHQPFYKDRLANRYFLPWVRLHAVRGYFDLPSILDDFPSIQVSFNLTPVLLLQLQDYATNASLQDDFLVVSRKPATSLSASDKEFILANFFMINWDRIVKPHLRYLELLTKRGVGGSRDEILKAIHRYETQDFLDLQVLFNLLWFGPIARGKFVRIQELINKNSHYTETEKNEVLSLQFEVLREVLPLYLKLAARGSAELTVSPFYHPILPLLWNGGGGQGYPWQSDARSQVQNALDYAKSLGIEVKGMWPSEGSVSESIIPIMAESGVRWIATDEDILFHSISGGRRESVLYRPHWVEIAGQRCAVFFRDRTLSDIIGFSYSRMPSDRAVDDFMRRLHDIKRQVQNEPGEPIVSVILDGENPWDYYEDGGETFLRRLYERLTNDPEIQTVRFSDYLQRHPPTETLRRLFSGSWINHNFHIWFGHEEDFQAWDYVKKTRDFLEKANLPSDKTAAAWEELKAAEGSDWFWWFGDDFSTTTEELFDFIFRNHLSNVYRIAGKRIPAFLKTPIKKAKSAKVKREPTALLDPVLDGRPTTYYEWYYAGFYAVDEPSGAMEQGVKTIRSIYYGFDLQNCFFRIDLNPDLKPEMRQNLRIVIQLHAKNDYLLDFIPTPSEPNRYLLAEVRGEEKIVLKEFNSIAVREVVEIGLPFSGINASSGDVISFLVTVEHEGVKLEEWPKNRMISFKVPDQNYENLMWNV